MSYSWIKTENLDVKSDPQVPDSGGETGTVAFLKGYQVMLAEHWPGDAYQWSRV
jgi:hypothetical protein